MKTFTQPLAVILALFTLTSAAIAQVTPDRLYYGVNRPIPFTVTAPEGSQEIQLALYNGPGTSIITRATVRPGPIDLFEVFPILWNRTQPKPFYLQTIIDGEQTGSPIFLEPLRPPLGSKIDPRNSSVAWDADRRRPYTGLRAYPAKFLEFSTTQGDFTMKLRPDEAPNTARHILELVEGGFYTDIVIHRIIPVNANGDPFVVQFGDPRGYGLGGVGEFIDLEPSSIKHDFGVVSMARQGDNPDSNGSQMFLCLSRAATQHLDNNYTAFGEIISGADTLIALENVPMEDTRRGTPADPKPIVRSAHSIPAPPINQWPARVTRPAPSTEQPR